MTLLSQTLKANPTSQTMTKCALKVFQSSLDFCLPGNKVFHPQKTKTIYMFCGYLISRLKVRCGQYITKKYNQKRVEAQIKTEEFLKYAKLRDEK